MEIEFEINGQKFIFVRNPATGRATLFTPIRPVCLQHPLSLSTHFSFSLEKTWKHKYVGHEIIIKKKRPLVRAGSHPHSYEIIVDGKTIVTSTGF